MDGVDREALELLSDDELADLRRGLVRAYDRERWQARPNQERLSSLLVDTRLVIAEQRSRERPSWWPTLPDET